VRKAGLSLFGCLAVRANGHIIYEGKGFGGCLDEDFTKLLLADGFESICYRLPAHVFENGCLSLEISEPLMGIELCEFWVTKV
jgi:hypothetical protein